MGIGSCVLTRGIVSVIIGIVAFVWPGVTIGTLIALFAIYALFDGVVNLYLDGTGAWDATRRGDSCFRAYSGSSRAS